MLCRPRLGPFPEKSGLSNLSRHILGTKPSTVLPTFCPTAAAFAMVGIRDWGLAESQLSTELLIGCPPMPSSFKNASMARATFADSIFTGHTEVQRPQPVQCSTMKRSSSSRLFSILPFVACV